MLEAVRVRSGLNDVLVFPGNKAVGCNRPHPPKLTYKCAAVVIELTQSIQKAKTLHMRALLVMIPSC